MKKKHLHLWQEIYIPHIKCFYTHLRYRVKPQNVRTNTSLTPEELKGKALSTTAYHFSTNRLKIPAKIKVTQFSKAVTVARLLGVSKYQQRRKSTNMQITKQTSRFILGYVQYGPHKKRDLFQERNESLLSMGRMFLGYIFESRPNSCTVCKAGSVKTIGLSINGCAQGLFFFKLFKFQDFR